MADPQWGLGVVEAHRPTADTEANDDSRERAMTAQLKRRLFWSDVVELAMILSIAILAATLYRVT